MRLPDPPLLVITDRAQTRRTLEEIAEAAFRGGCRWLSLREKDLPPAERRALLARLIALGQSYGAIVGVHDDIDAAAALAAGALHLPAGAAVGAARARLGRALIGVSTHDPAGLERAAAESADYATLSPVFATQSKPGYGPALGAAALGAAARAARLPVIALGGMTGETVPEVIAAGAAGIAVMGEVMRAADPAAAVALLAARLRAALAAK